MKKETQLANQITEGIIWKQLLIFFFPIVFGTFFQQLYNTIDTIIVGHFIGKSALASVGGSSTQIVNLVVGFFTGLSSGASVIIAQFYGARDERSVQESLHTAYAFSILGSIAISIPGILLAPHLLRWMNTPAELIRDSALYLRIYFAGILFVFIFNVGSSILRAIGDSKHPLYYLMVCCLLNIILDILCVVWLDMGVAGAAIATFFSQAASAALVTRKLMVSGGILKLSLKQLRFHANVLRSLLRIGMPAGFQSIMYSLSNVIIQSALNSFGTDTVAAWSVYGKLDAVFWMISGAIGISITTFVGQNFGARKYGRVKKSVRVCLGIDALISGVLVIFFLLLRNPLFRIFTNDADVIRIGCEMMALITPCYMFFICIEVLSGALRGIGDVIIPTLITLGGVCLFRILWLFGALQIRPTVNAIILSYPVTWLTTSILFILYYLYRKRRTLASTTNNK
ncbi:MATE family efflux transporter [Schaedlerella sp.]|jgi:putative MATE family efflux protein|uniref:MATE family efflux transporter n=1 Tax=Schaedlerella sp. TaxID=2676057 RepID=UPI00136421FE|nr:MATE family efflux transporter [uncultured Schaedlerella sp.]MCI8767146.1 MATE family efflux transporter [Ruminococcus sp.]MCI9329244.1 MATE family efflux transporter [Ruminococcus sp.]NBJ01749.1 MATE family efflux transporter [Lachnospiraceae bacterium]